MAEPCSAALHRLNLDHCVSLTDPVVTAALQGLPALEFLSLNGCVGLREPLLAHKVLCEVLKILGSIGSCLCNYELQIIHRSCWH